MNIAWFSPFPPVKTGIATCSAELVQALTARGYRIDTYPESCAHDFPWRHRRQPYDLIVYQFGNSSHHDYEWAYALRYPGLIVLHDTRLHHARAALLLREKRAADYRREFYSMRPVVPLDAAELAVAGFDSRLFYEWPFVTGLLVRSRRVAVHGEATRRELVERLSAPNSRDGNPQAAFLDRIVAIRLGHGQFVTPEEEKAARTRIRARYGVAEDAVLFGIFGGLTPEKRIPQILAAYRGLLPHAPAARLMLGGDYAGAPDGVVVTGYLTDDELTDHIAAVDVSLNLRWPTARETSGPWLRALAAGKPTVILDLVHLADVPSLDPQTWATRETGGRREARQSPICVAIDILDEDHSLRLALRRLATDRELREALGRAAQDYWKRQHSLEAMTDDYEKLMRDSSRLASHASHVEAAGDERLEELLRPFGIPSPL